MASYSPLRGKTPSRRVPAASPSKYRITSGLNPPVPGVVQIGRRGDEVLGARGQPSEFLGAQSAVSRVDVAQTAGLAIRQEGAMQRLVPAAHPEGEDRLLLSLRVENVGVGAKRQPDKFRQPEATFELIPRFPVSDETRIEALKRRDHADLGQRRLPRVEHVIGTARAQVDVSRKVNR